MDFLPFFETDSWGFKLMLSTLLGSALGLERFLHGRPAGLRTHLLVCLASTLMMEISISSVNAVSDTANELGRFVDPTRVAAGVITGIGFLGAGVILRSSGNIQGLTSAACIWMAAVLGLAIGAGLYQESVIVCIISILALILMKEMEGRLARDIYRVIHIEAADENNIFENITDLAGKSCVKIYRDGFQRTKEDQSIKIELVVKINNEQLAKDYCNSVYALDSVKVVSLWKKYQ